MSGFPSTSASASSSSAPSKKKLTREQQHRKAQKHAAKVRQKQQEASGINSFAKQKTVKEMNKHAEKVTTRFKYASFNHRLKDVHLAPAAISSSASYRPMAGLDNPLALQAAVPDSADAHLSAADSSSLLAATAFAEALNTWLELNQSIPFQDLYRQLYTISRSLPLLLHHRSRIISLLSSCLSRPDQWLAWDAALDLLPRLATDLGSEFLPIFPDALRAAIHITTSTKAITKGDERAAALLVERAFQSSAFILKAVSPLVISKQSASAQDDDMDVDAEEVQPDLVEVDQRTYQLVQTWNVIRPYLGWKTLATQPDSTTEIAENDDSGDVNEDDQDEAEEEQDEEQDPLQTSATRKAPTPRVSIFTRRFASEAFAHLLRKTRGKQLSNMVGVMLHDLEEMVINEDQQDRYVKYRNKRPSSSFARGIAGVFAEGCKSVEKRLHSRASTLLHALFSSRNSASPPSYAHLARLTVARLTLTSLVHHSQATHFAPIVDQLIQLVEQTRDALSTIDAKTPEDQARSITVAALESVEWLATAVGVRKGTRVAGKCSISSLTAYKTMLTNIVPFSSFRR